MLAVVVRLQSRYLRLQSRHLRLQSRYVLAVLSHLLLQMELLRQLPADTKMPPPRGSYRASGRSDNGNEIVTERSLQNVQVAYLQNNATFFIKNTSMCLTHATHNSHCKKDAESYAHCTIQFARH